MPLTREQREAGMCRTFGSTLKGAALRWFYQIPNGSIRSFSQLVNLFNAQFASSRLLEKQTSDLYRLIQGPTKSLRAYLTRFNTEMISIPRCDATTAVEAFRQGLFGASELYDELTKYTCQTFDDVKAKALAHVRLEEDRLSRTRLESCRRTTNGRT